MRSKLISGPQAVASMCDGRFVHELGWIGIVD